MGLGHQEGPLSSRCESLQMIGLVPRKCHLVCLAQCLAEAQRMVAGALCLMQYPLSTWKMQMIFKFGSSVQAACIYPTASLKQVTNRNMCSFYFYKAGRTRECRAKLVGFEISLFTGLAAVWSDSNTQWQLHGNGPDPPRCSAPWRPWSWVNGPAFPFHLARRWTKG